MPWLEVAGLFYDIGDGRVELLDPRDLDLRLSRIDAERICLRHTERSFAADG
jgi:hypothetical protein